MKLNFKIEACKLKFETVVVSENSQIPQQFFKF